MAYVRPLSKDHLFVSALLQEVAVDVLSPSRRRDSALEHLRQPRLWRVPTGSVFLWLRLPEGWDDVVVSRRAMLAGVQVFFGRAVGGLPAPELRRRAPEGLEEGIRRLAEALRARG